jgi:hypothetical protein
MAGDALGSNLYLYGCTALCVVKKVLRMLDAEGRVLQAIANGDLSMVFHSAAQQS